MGLLGKPDCAMAGADKSPAAAVRAVRRVMFIFSLPVLCAAIMGCALYS
jgi:hypothetical protein